MTDSSAGFKNSKNNLPKGFAGSLTLRIFFTVLVFLIIPLWVYALLMYRYNKELDGVRQGRSLQLISEIQILGFEKLEYEMQEILDLLKLDAQDFSSAKMDKTSFQKRLDRAAQFEGVGRVVFLSKGEGGELQCVLSSPSCEGVEDFSTLFFSEKLQSNDELSSLIDKGNRLAFIKVVARGAQGAPLSALVLDMATETLMRMLTQAQGYAGGYSIALFSQDSYHILSSQDSNLMGKTLVFKPASAEGELFLERLFGIQDTYSYKIDKNTLYATLLEVADHSFGILVSASYYKDPAFLQMLAYKSMILFGCIVVFGVIGTLLFTFLMGRPLKNLCHVMQEVREHNLKAQYKKSSYGFEINQVGEFFNKTLQDVIAYLHELEQKTLQSEKLKKELLIGQQIQKNLIPKELPDVPGLQLKTVLIPAKDVGGDFYDFFINPLNKEELFLIMADTSGHGVFGCFYALTMRSILRSLGAILNDLATILRKANGIFYKDTSETQVFVTTWMGTYNIKTRQLCYSSCGHPLGFVFRKGKLFKELATEGIALGVLASIDPKLETVQLASQDTVILITDGVIEARNTRGELFGKQRFIEAVESFCHLSVQELCEKITQIVEEFEETPENQEDDFTLLIVRVE